MPSAAGSPQDTDQLTDLVIFVHGTFAGDEEHREHGSRWWQRGSRPWDGLEARLPAGVQLPGPQTRLFHWSGKNLQSERLEASTALLIELLKLEREGRRYHLVGHSHGGSVIFEALVSAETLRTRRRFDSGFWHKLREQHLYGADYPHGRREKYARARLATRDQAEVRSLLQLPGLRSWTTVGTPFLRFRSTRLRFVRRRPIPDLTDANVRTDAYEGPSFFWALVLLVGALLLVFGSLLFFQGLTHRQDASGQVNRALLGPALGAIGGMLACVVGFTLSGLYELVGALWIRQGAERAAFERFATRWLGLWAPTDEAIALLTAVAPRGGKPAVPPVPLRLKVPGRATGLIPSAAAFVPLRSVRFQIYRMFNRVMAPRISARLSKLLTETIQGCDIAGMEIVTVSAWPSPIASPPPGLPAAVADRLEQQARTRTADLGPVSRAALAQALLDGAGIAQTFAAQASPSASNALVHTSYFDDPQVLDLIALHIRRNSAACEDRATCGNPDLSAWLDSLAASVTAHLKPMATGGNQLIAASAEDPL